MVAWDVLRQTVESLSYGVAPTDAGPLVICGVGDCGFGAS